MWFATSDGLNRYDGYTIKIYRNDPDDATSLVNNVVRSLLLDQENRLWIGTQRGVSRYSKETDSFENFLLDSLDLKNTLVNQVDAIVENSRQQVFASAENGFIYQFIPDENRFIPINSYDFGVIKDVVIDEKDNFWIGSMTNGLFYYNPHSKLVKSIPSGKDDKYTLIDGSVNALLLNDGDLWVGTWNHGVVKYHIATGEFSHYFEHIPFHNYVNQIYCDRSGNIWVGDSYGLLLYDVASDDFVVYHHKKDDPSSLATIGVRCVYEDCQGNFWVCSAMGGINLAVVKKAFTHYTVEEGKTLGLTKNIISSILQDHNGALWFGSFNDGIDVLDLKHQKKKHYEPNPLTKGSLGEGTVNFIFEDSAHQIWVGTSLGGLQKLDSPGKFITYKHREDSKNTISGDDVRCMAEDADGNLWLSIHSKGLDRFNRKTGEWKNYQFDPDRPDETLAGNWTLSLLIDSSGILWVGTPNGLSAYQPEKEVFINYRYNADNDSSISNSNVLCLYEDRSSGLWVGTIDGLNQLNRKTGTFTRYLQKNGLPNTVINSILEDDFGNLWIGTNNGLSRFSIKDKNFRNYDIYDGLSSNEFIARSCFRSMDGELFFGTNNGVIAFYPTMITDNAFIPPVFLTDIKLFNHSIPVQPDMPDALLKKDISETDKLVLEHGQNILTFEYVALNFINSEKNQYAYQLEGFDNRWNYVGSQRQATYTNLDPGQYCFKVKASNNDGIWNEAGTHLDIVIKPPFWVTWWFRGGVIILGLVIIFGFIRWRTLVFKRQNEELERQIQIQKDKLIEANKQLLLKERLVALGQLTATVAHEIRNPLGTVRASIFSLNEAYQKNNRERIERSLILAERNIVRCDAIITELLDYTRNRDQKMATVEITEWLKRLIDEQDIPGAIDLQLELNDPAELSIDKGEFYRAMVNVIENAVQAMMQREDGKSINRLTIQTLQKEAQYEIRVSDTGPGITEENRTKILEPLFSTKTYGIGLGLPIVQKIMQGHNGGLELISEYGQGTTVILWLPTLADSGRVDETE